MYKLITFPHTPRISNVWEQRYSTAKFSDLSVYGNANVRVSSWFLENLTQYLSRNQELTRNYANHHCGIWKTSKILQLYSSFPKRQIFLGYKKKLLVYRWSIFEWSSKKILRKLQLRSKYLKLRNLEQEFPSHVTEMISVFFSYPWPLVSTLLFRISDLLYCFEDYESKIHYFWYGTNCLAQREPNCRGWLINRRVREMKVL